MMYKFISTEIKYNAVQLLQAHLVKERMAGRIGDLVLFCQHPPTFTVGRRIKEYPDLKRLESLGADFLYTLRVRNLLIGW